MARSFVTLCPHLRVQNIIWKGRRGTDGFHKGRDKISLAVREGRKCQKGVTVLVGIASEAESTETAGFASMKRSSVKNDFFPFS